MAMHIWTVIHINKTVFIMVSSNNDNQSSLTAILKLKGVDRRPVTRSEASHRLDYGMQRNWTKSRLSHL